jgi:PBSX family phage terminase large subunit
MAAVSAPEWAIAPYNPTTVPWQLRALGNKSRILLCTGSAGGGKSRMAGEKLHAFCLKYPGAMTLALRKTRQSMTNSTVLFLERTVIGKDPRVVHRKTDHRFEYSNGSVLAYGGMKDEDQREQVRSIGLDGGVDMIWMEEATRFTEDDFNELLPRLRAKAGSFRQILLTTNPAGPMHWIRQRLILGKLAEVIRSGAVDNPHNGEEYLETLNLLTGVLRDRLVDGEWVAEEGAVYAEFDESNVTTADREPDPKLPIEIAFDDGYVDPRAILFIQRTGAEIFVYDEIYQSRKLDQYHVDMIVDRCAERWGWKDAARRVPNKLPELAVGSPEAVELKERLRLADIPVRMKTHEIVEGIKVVRRLVRDGNDHRTIKVHPRCTNLIGEITGGYQYPKEGSRRDDETPIDENNHAVDALRYWCYTRARKAA